MSPLLRLIIICSLTFAVYSFMLSSPFKTMDDQVSIVANPLIKDTAHWPQLFKQGYFGDKSYYRPLVNLSFSFEHALFGLDPFFYNLDNMLIHMANALLVWWLVTMLVNAHIGFWVALLFAVHPVQWEAVANISGRAILLSSFFSLSAFIAFIKNRQFFALGSFALALLCKESSAVLPGILFVYCLVNGRKLTWVWWWGGLIIAYMALRKYLGMTHFFPWRNATEHTLGILTFLRSVITHIRIMIFPVDLHFDRSMKLFSHIMDAGAMMTVFVWATLLAWLGAARKHIKGIEWLCLAWFALDLLPVSQIVTTIGVQPGSISTAEHFLYMGVIPFLVIAVTRLMQLALYLRERKVISDLTIKITVACVLVSFCCITVSQNIYAQNELLMMERSLKIQPANARLQSSVGLIYALQGDFKTAQAHFHKAVEAEPLNARYRVSFAQSLCDQGKWIECLGQNMAIDQPGGYQEMINHNALNAYGYVQESITAGMVLDANGWMILGIYYAKTMAIDQAIQAFDKVLEFDANNADAIFNLASIYEGRQQWDQAALYYQRMLKLDSAVSPALIVHAQTHLKQIEGH